MTEFKLNEDWLAGFFDGEGCFKITKQHGKNGKEYKHASIMLSQSGEDGLLILLKIQQEYGGKIYHHLKIGEHKATKNAYKLYWNKDEGKTFLNRIIPRLILKRKDAELVLSYLERKGIYAKA